MGIPILVKWQVISDTTIPPPLNICFEKHKATCNAVCKSCQLPLVSQAQLFILAEFVVVEHSSLGSNLFFLYANVVKLN